MNSSDFIIDSLKSLHNKFVQSNIRYEFLHSIKIHLIEITPKEFYKCNDYINEELKLEEMFGELYYEEDIVFITDDSLNKIVNPLFEVYGEKTGTFRTNFSEVSNAGFIDSFLMEEVCYVSENEFALAA